MKYKLSERTLNLLVSLCSFRVATTEQIAKYFYTSTAENHLKATMQVLSRLHTENYISRTYIYNGSRPNSAWYVSRQNLHAIKIELQNTRRSDIYEELFEDAEYDVRSSAKLQQNTLVHEIGITSVFLALCDSIKHTKLSLPVWINTSPTHPLLSTKITATKTSKKTQKKTTHNLPVNPDGFFILDDGNDRTFYFLEFDNNTETLVSKITNKFIAYYAHNKQKIFKNETLTNLAQAYNLKERENENIGVRVLFITTTANRRDDLFIKSTVMPAGDLFLFTTLEDLQNNPFGAHWLAKSSFAPFFEEYWDMMQPKNPKAPRTRPSIARAFRTKAIKDMDKVCIP